MTSSPIHILTSIRERSESLNEEGREMFRQHVTMIREAMRLRASRQQMGQFAGGHLLALYTALTRAGGHADAIEMTVAVFAVAFAEEFGVEMEAPTPPPRKPS